ncbi:hypothetical protein [Nocardia fluminea]|uniref:hypothetical protein n=1 Tax=Nocardia fluminea TaxID=134984 RepID=UPI0033FB5A88
MSTPPNPDAFAVLSRLVTRFDGEARVISTCGPRIEQRARQWLDHHDFAARTGIPREHWRFCGTRAGKAPHRAELGITHMIDDRLDLHTILRELVPRLYLFGAQAGPIPGWLTHTPDWRAVGRAVGADLAGQALGSP